MNNKLTIGMAAFFGIIAAVSFALGATLSAVIFKHDENQIDEKFITLVESYQTHKFLEEYNDFSLAVTFLETTQKGEMEEIKEELEKSYAELIKRKLPHIEERLANISNKKLYTSVSEQVELAKKLITKH